MKQKAEEQNKGDRLDLTRPGIIDASAGTGKTYNIAEIYLSLLLGKKSYALDGEGDADDSSKGDAPKLKEILVVTFTIPATEELSSRLRKRIQQELENSKEGTLTEKKGNEDEKDKLRLRLALANFDDAQVFTIHGFCTRILKEFHLECGIPPSPKFGGDVRKERERFAQQFLKRKEIEEKRSSGGGDEMHIGAELLSKLVEELEKFPNLKFGGKEGDLAKEAFEEWQKLRKKGDAISYNEMLIRLLDALKGEEGLGAKIAARYKAALVDEFQDTDPLQWEIFKRIFLNNGVPFFCVGDPKQSIYKFRGGDVETYKSAREEIRAVLKEEAEKKGLSEFNELTLSRNWRSSAELIAAFNEIFSKDETLDLPGREPGVLEYKNAEPAPDEETKEIPKAKETPAVFLKKIGFNETLKPRAREKVRDALVEDINTLVNKRGILSPGQIAILVRKNETGQEYLKALEGIKVPATTTANGSVLASEEAGDFEALMDALFSPKDSAKVTRAALTSFFGDYFKEAILSRASNGGSDAVGELEKFQEVLSAQKSVWEKSGFVAAFAGITNEFHCFELLSSNTRRITNVRHLLELINDREHRKTLTPGGLVRDFKRWRSEKHEDDETLQVRADTDRDAVCIQTIHKSKGLEYDFVFLPDLWDNGKKSESFVRTKEGGRHCLYLKGEKGFDNALIRENVQNEASLFYVALTRAKSAGVIYQASVTTKDPNKPKTNSYADNLLKKVFEGKEEHKHVQILAIGDTPPLPKHENDENSSSVSQKEGDKRDLSAEEKRKEIIEKRKETLKVVRKRTSVDDAFDIFSYSRILGEKNKGIQEEHYDEDGDEAVSSKGSNDEDGDNATPSKGSNNKDGGEKLYGRKPWWDLEAGTQFGTTVHKIFEKAFTQGADDDKLKKIVEREVESFPSFSSKSSDEQAKIREKLYTMVRETCEKGVCEEGVKKLSEVERKDCACEMEFYFPIEKSNDLCVGLRECLEGSTEKIYKRTATRYFGKGSKNFPIEGFMVGLIDLVVRVGEKFFIVDWKTNKIADKAKLTRDDLENEMVEHGYALQGLIYAVALRKFLKKIYGDDHARHLGGVSFFFVRWKAIYTCKIDEKILNKMEDVISGANRNNKGSRAK